MLRSLYSNHVLANLTFVLILIIGAGAYQLLPRQQDPTINFNWIDIATVMPGGTTEDIEKQVTDVLEDALRKISDVKFVSSTSKPSLSHILVRFEDIPERLYDKRIADLRREIQNAQDELPDIAEDPVIFEVTSSNAFPSATLVVSGQADDENLRRQAELVRKDLERMKGVDRVIYTGLNEPELQIDFHPERLASLGLSPNDLADTVSLYFRDLSAGTREVMDESWMITIKGKSSDPAYLAALPVPTTRGEVTLGSIADIHRGRSIPQHMVRYEGHPSVMMGITKKGGTNTLELVERINQYVGNKNMLSNSTGVTLTLVDDQTEITRNALSVMQNNALLGLFMVMVVTWLFLGTRIALLTSIGIPFILAGTFALMLVDDAVVVVEAIYYRLQRGAETIDASISALREVFAPVTSAVLTTIAAFLPLMLLPGILGKYMMVVPMVVTIALILSLLEAYWMLPAHVMGLGIRFDAGSKMHQWRTRWLHYLRIQYTRLLVRALRHPRKIMGITLLLFITALVASFGGQAFPELLRHPIAKHFFLRADFFASDPIRLFYINIEMPSGTPLEKTLNKALEAEKLAQRHLVEGEARAITTYAGQMFTETAPLQGDHYGQVTISLNPKRGDMRSVDEIIASMRADIEALSGADKIYFLEISGGPPTSVPVSVKVRGDEIKDIRAAVRDIKAMMRQKSFYKDITDDDTPGLWEMVLTINTDAVRRSGISPAQILRATHMLVDGEIVASLQDRGETVDVRVRARPEATQDISEMLEHELVNAQGEVIPLRSLVHVERRIGQGNIRHYNFRRTITLQADINKELVDTVQANQVIKDYWRDVRSRYPDIDLDFSGTLDDIQESLSSIFLLMIFGVLLMYLILGTQFKSYFQPFLILVTVPMAFTGVVLGLLITANPLSLYTLYGVVALAGIAVNAAIVLISAANARIAAGMSVLHATLYAGRRRVIPILITSMTTVAGLFSLAVGLGGKSLIWGPVATAIVWGLMLSTILTLFLIPILYRSFMAFSHRKALLKAG
jgi:multidrug efflux pump subunit AcrB